MSKKLPDEEFDLEGFGENAKEGVKSFVERITKLEEDKEEIQADLREVYAEAKGTGFNPKILRRAVAFSRMDKAKRDEDRLMIDLYLEAMGLL